ncbi:MAG: helix-turn-helix domain-containing protein [Planctomycetota bacterium]
MTRKKKTTRDALEIIDKHFYAGHPERQAGLEEAEASAAIARQIYQMREEAGITQRELADRVGTTASVICRLEDDDYEGHSLGMLRRIAAALGKRVEIRILPAKRRSRSA